MYQEDINKLQQLLIKKYKKYAKKKECGLFWFNDEEYGACAVFYNYRNGILFSVGTIDTHRSGAPIKTEKDIMYFCYEMSFFTLFDERELSNPACKKAGITKEDLCEKTKRVPVIMTSKYDGEDGIIRAIPKLIDSVMNLSFNKMNKIKVRNRLDDMLYYDYKTDFLGLAGIQGAVFKNVCYDKSEKKVVSERYRFDISMDNEDRSGLSTGVTFWSLSRKEIKLLKKAVEIFIHKTIDNENKRLEPNSPNKEQYIYKPGEYLRNIKHFKPSEELIKNSEIVELNSSEWFEMWGVYHPKEKIHYEDIEYRTEKELLKNSKKVQNEKLAAYFALYWHGRCDYECYEFYLKTKGMSIPTKVKKLMSIKGLSTEEEFFEFAKKSRGRS